MDTRFKDEDWKKGVKLREKKPGIDVRHFLVAAIIQATKDNVMISELHQMLDELAVHADNPKYAKPTVKRKAK